MLLFSFFLAAAFAQPADETAPPPPGEWAWLNIPGVEGPGARFSYETAVRRVGSRLEIRLRYNEADAVHPNRATIPIEARIAIDCASRTQQLLERRPGRRGSRAAAAAPILGNTREWTLAYLLCPRSDRP